MQTNIFRAHSLQSFFGTKAPQSRVIPVRKSITPEHRIGTYDELEHIIEMAGDRIRIGECICRKSMQLAGRSCAITSRSDTCMGFREFGELMGRTGWGRSISKEEALEIATQNEKDGLVLQPANEQDVQFICSCCGDCCGILRSIKAMPRPAEFVATNYYAQIKVDLCNGCSVCVDRCQMDAITLPDALAAINRDRCIGCGLCVPTCAAEGDTIGEKAQRVGAPERHGSAF